MLIKKSYLPIILVLISTFAQSMIENSIKEKQNSKIETEYLNSTKTPIKTKSLINILERLGDRMYCIAEIDRNENGDIALELKKATKEVAEIFNTQMIDINSEENIDAFLAAAANGNTEIMNLFINAKFNVNAVDKTKKTAAMYACADGNIETLRVLICNGADLSLKDNAGLTAEKACELVQTSNNYMFAFPRALISYVRYPDFKHVPFYSFKECKKIIINEQLKNLSGIQYFVEKFRASKISLTMYYNKLISYLRS